MKKLSIFLLIMTSFAFVGCVDKNVKAERKAYDELLMNSDLEGIRDFKSKFADYITEEHLKTVDSLYDVFIADSTLFAAIQEMPDDKILPKYKKMNEYLEKYPNGLNAFEANEFLYENRNEIERVERLLKQFNAVVNRYDYYNQNSSGYLFEFFTLGPANDEGIGDITVYTRGNIFEDWKRAENFSKYRVYEVDVAYNTIELMLPEQTIEAKVSERNLNFDLNGRTLFFDSHLKNDIIKKTIMGE
jgi:hypothetical protein